MTISEALTNAAEKARLYHEARRNQDQLYAVHSRATVAAETAQDLWREAMSKTNMADRDWNEASATLTKVILEISNSK